MKREILWFLIAGFSAVGTDLLAYYLLKIVIPIFIAKAISFVIGSVVAFFINKYKTFQKDNFSKLEIGKFSILYLSTLGANVTVNNISLLLIPEWIFFAFLSATGTSTILNYIGQKYWVFKK